MRARAAAGDELDAAARPCEPAEGREQLAVRPGDPVELGAGRAVALREAATEGTPAAVSDLYEIDDVAHEHQAQRPAPVRRARGEGVDELREPARGGGRDVRQVRVSDQHERACAPAIGTDRRSTPRAWCNLRRHVCAPPSTGSTRRAPSSCAARERDVRPAT
jgi:hypothetical protein